MTDDIDRLIDAARNGDKAALERLLEVIRPRLIRTARATLSDRSYAEDVANEASVLICRALASLTEIKAFWRLIDTIATRVALRFNMASPTEGRKPSELRASPTTEGKAPAEQFETLIDRSRSGDKAALDRLLEVIRPRLIRTARATLSDRSYAEDVANEASVLIFRAIASLTEIKAFWSWIDTITTRVALRFNLKHRDDPVDFSEEQDDPAVQQLLRAFSSAMERVEHWAAEAFWRCFNKLAQKARTWIWLHHVEGYSYVEIAEREGASASQVKNRIQYGKAQVRGCMTASE